jgi:hypothetical protein
MTMALADVATKCTQVREALANNVQSRGVTLAEAAAPHALHCVFCPSQPQSLLAKGAKGEGSGVWQTRDLLMYTRHS